jgi:hypothetical protein
MDDIRGDFVQAPARVEATPGGDTNSTTQLIERFAASGVGVARHEFHVVSSVDQRADLVAHDDVLPAGLRRTVETMDDRYPHG